MATLETNLLRAYSKPRSVTDVADTSRYHRCTVSKYTRQFLVEGLIHKVGKKFTGGFGAPHTLYLLTLNGRRKLGDSK